MGTLQKTLNYMGPGTVPAGLRMTFDVPVFAYAELQAPAGDNAPARTVIQREAVGRYRAVAVIDGATYGVEVSECEMARGADPALRRRYLLSQFTRGDAVHRINLEDISFVVTVDIQHGEQSLGQQELEVIEVLGLGKRNEQETFFVNKRSYARLVDRLNLGAFGTVLLAALFNTIERQEDGVAVPARQFVAAVGNLLLTTLYRSFAEPRRKALLDALPALLKRIEEFDLASLVDFPVEVPAVELATLQAGGSFTVEASDPAMVSAATLDLYQLSVEYPSARATRTAHAEWNRRAGFRANEPLPFSLALPDAAPGPLTVRVRGLANTVLWQRNVDPRSEHIDAIAITVPLVQPASLGAPATPSGTGARKLRGQVIPITPATRVRGLTVLIQARRESSAPWRIVGAA